MILLIAKLSKPYYTSHSKIQWPIWEQKRTLFENKREITVGVFFHILKQSQNEVFFEKKNGITSDYKAYRCIIARQLYTNKQHSYN